MPLFSPGQSDSSSWVLVALAGGMELESIFYFAAYNYLIGIYSEADEKEARQLSLLAINKQQAKDQNNNRYEGRWRIFLVARH